MRPRRRELLAFTLVSLLILTALFRDALLKGSVLGQGELLLQFEPWRSHAPAQWRPGNTLLADSPMVFLPFLEHAREVVRSGHFPLWSSQLSSGMPFFAAFQSAVLSPFTLPAYLLPIPQALTVVAALRLLVGGLGMFLFLRALPVSCPAAVFGGVGYLLNPFSVVWLEHPLSAVAAWVPWLLLAIERSVSHRRRIDVAVMAVATAMTLLAGHPETAFKVMLLAGAYGVYRSAQTERPLWHLLRLGAGVGLGLLVCAVQLVPFLEYAAQSRVLAQRSSSSSPHFTIPPVGLAAAFVPDFFGNPVARRYVLDAANYCEQQIYPGIATWLLALASIAVARDRRRVVFFLGAASAAALIMYGTPAAALAVAALPPLRVAALSRFGLITIVCLIVAAAMAFDRLFPEDTEAGDVPGRLPVAVTAAAVAVAAAIGTFFWSQYAFLEAAHQAARTGESVGVALLWVAAVVAAVWTRPMLPRLAAAAILTCILAADLFTFADGFHPLKPAATTFADLPELEPIRSDPGLFRVAGWEDTLIPNSALAYGLNDFRGYDGIGIRQYTDLLDIAFRFNGSFHAVSSFSSPHLLDLLNVKYLLARDDIDVPAGRFTIVRDGPVRVYRNDSVFPRAFLTDSYVVRQGDEARRLIRSGGVDLRRTAILEAAPAGVPAPSGRADAGTAEIQRYDDRGLTIVTRAPGASLLVVTDAFYPGWTARVDDRVVPILRADYAFRAVVVPAGTHTVRFDYRPASFQYGVAGSGIGVLVAGLLAMPRRRQRGGPPAHGR